MKLNTKMIKKLMKDDNLTIRKLSKKLHIKEKVIRGWLSGERTPSFIQLKLLSSIFLFERVTDFLIEE